MCNCCQGKRVEKGKQFIASEGVWLEDFKKIYFIKNNTEVENSQTLIIEEQNKTSTGWPDESHNKDEVNKSLMAGLHCGPTFGTKCYGKNMFKGDAAYLLHAF